MMRNGKQPRTRLVVVEGGQARAMRRFTVGFGKNERQVRVEAADEGTRQWALRHASVMQVAFARFVEDVKDCKLAPDPALGFAVPLGIESPRTLSARLLAILARAFPEERIEVLPESPR